MEKIEIRIKGMECASCEILLERKFKEIPGVNEAHLNQASGKATLLCSRVPSLGELQDAVKDTKYKVLTEEEKESNDIKKSTNTIKIKKDHLEIGGVLIIVLAIYLVLKQFNVLSKILPNIGISNNMTYGLIFLIGIVAAFSTCAAVTGSLLMAVTTKYNENNPNLTAKQKIKPQIYFNLGRIASYTILGGALGALGSVFKLSTLATGIITITASIVMILLGLQLLKISPWLDHFKIKMPKFIGHRIHDASNTKSKSAPLPFIFGSSTFFLPCGFTQALQLYVLSKGDFVTGALTMLVFSLGTLPALLSLGAISSFTKGTFKRYFTKFIAVIVIIFGIVSISNGFTLTGMDIGFDSLLPSASATKGINGNDDVKIIDGKQIVNMKINGLSYYPSKFTVLAGVPVEFNIDGRDAVGCAQVIHFQSLDITEYLPKNQVKTITFIPKAPGTIRFSCTMGMAGPGVFNVIENTQGIKGAEIVEAKEQDNELNKDGEVQKLFMEISREKGFYPNAFTVKKNIPVELEIDTKVPLRGCMSVMLIPEYNIAHSLTKVGKSVLKFIPNKEGNLPFTCGMGARMGYFKVVS